MQQQNCHRVYRSPFVCEKKSFLKAIRIGLLLSAVLLPMFISGCMRMGPGMIPRDQFDYAVAIGDARNQQILMNIVKIRYGDWPVFLEVHQVVAGYNWEQTGRADITLRRIFDSIVRDTGGLGYTGKFVERPTITYSPLKGEDFVRNILTPVRPEALLSLIQSGWPADKLFHTMVQSINGKRNRHIMYGTDYSAEPEFIRFVNLLKKIHIVNAISVRVRQTEDQDLVRELSFRTHMLSPEILRELNEVKSLLGLNLDVDAYSIIWDSISEDPNTIAIQTRSVIQVMAALAAFIEVPQDDIKKVGAFNLGSARKNNTADSPPLMQIRNGASAPKDAFVAVRYHNKAFWIDDHDWNSKASLAFLTLLLTVTESGDVKGPQLTISAG
jgi:hypothetical protein